MKNIEKIEIKSKQYVWIDKDAEIKIGDIVLEDLMNGKYLIMTIHTTNDIDAEIQVKIIASSPELNLKGVPTYVEWLGTQRAIERRWDPKSLETRRVANEIIEGVKFGYQTAEKELPTWDDVKTVWKAGQEYWKTSGASITLEELLEQLKQSKK